MAELREVVVVDALRTPIGRLGGALATVRADDLAAFTIRELVARTKVDPDRIDDVFWGAANQAGEDNRNVARMAALLAGLPITVPGTTVTRLCASGLQAVNSAAQAIASGCGDIMIAGGVESMTRAPYVMPKADKVYDRSPKMFDTTLGWRMVNPNMPVEYTVSMGETAENVADQYKITREEQDAFALASQQKTKSAVERGVFAAEIVALPQLAADEHPRPQTTAADLAKLKPAFKKNGTVTAGNSSGINDGAAALLLCSADVAAKNGWQPLARVVTSAVAGVDPAYMGLGPIPATSISMRSTKHSHRRASRACAISRWIRPRLTSTAARSRSVIRSVVAAPGSPEPCCTNCAAARDAMPSRRCVSVSDKGSRRFSNASSGAIRRRESA
jgi:acetyl-CoA acetyltransferase family protein